MIAQEVLPAATNVGGVSLDVADLAGQTRFYRDVLLLDVVAEVGNRVQLGKHGQTLVTLRHRPDLPRGERRSAGLFHTALLHASAADLATTLGSLAITHPDLFTGSGDHLVSQAFYLDDPEGNGVELYVDRPREQWNWHDGRVVMDTLFLDPNQFLTDHLTHEGKELLATDPDRRPGAAVEQVVGHVHLKVGQTALAKHFYADVLGFEVTAEMPGALFVSAGGYHHHLAMNTWQSAGVGLRAPALGLGRVEVVLPNVAALEQAAARLRANGSDPAYDGSTVEVADPWGNLVSLRVG